MRGWRIVSFSPPGSRYAKRFRTAHGLMREPAACLGGMLLRFGPRRIKRRPSIAAGCSWIRAGVGMDRLVGLLPITPTERRDWSRCEQVPREGLQLRREPAASS